MAKGTEGSSNFLWRSHRNEISRTDQQFWMSKAFSDCTMMPWLCEYEIEQCVYLVNLSFKSIETILIVFVMFQKLSDLNENSNTRGTTTDFREISSEWMQKSVTRIYIDEVCNSKNHEIYRSLLTIWMSKFKFPLDHFQKKSNLLSPKLDRDLDELISSVLWPQKANYKTSQSAVLQSIRKFHSLWGIATGVALEVNDHVDSVGQICLSSRLLFIWDWENCRSETRIPWMSQWIKDELKMNQQIRFQYSCMTCMTKLVMFIVASDISKRER
jgi:hypothetical protein